VEVTGFEPVTTSLRKTRLKPSDQGKRHASGVLWRGCGASGVRFRENCSTRYAAIPATEALTGNHNVARSLFRVGHDDQLGLGSYVADHGAR
jgi:hypothetical protein